MVFPYPKVRKLFVRPSLLARLCPAMGGLLPRFPVRSRDRLGRRHVFRSEKSERGNPGSGRRLRGRRLLCPSGRGHPKRQADDFAPHRVSPETMVRPRTGNSVGVVDLCYSGVTETIERFSSRLSDGRSLREGQAIRRRAGHRASPKRMKLANRKPLVDCFESRYDISKRLACHATPCGNNGRAIARLR